MKAVVAQVKNITATYAAFQNLSSRHKFVPGVGLIHGESGYGKTTAVTWLINQISGVYYRMRASDSVGSMLRGIYREVAEAADVKPKRIADYAELVVEKMSVGARPLFIDEADHLFRASRSLETIRDIYDLSEMPVILIGMGRFEAELREHRQLKNRISEYVKFHATDAEDLSVMCDEMLEGDIQLSDELIDKMIQKTGGVIRELVTLLSKVEKIALSNDISRLSLSDCRELL